jgi:hypothetical protein
MRPLRTSDLAGLEAYARLRDEYRRAVIAYKRTRRMAVGEKVTLLFEDRETLRFQVQEMLLVERIADPQHVQHELDVYNELMPGEGELSATLFIEIEEQSRIRPELDRLVGIDEHVSLRLGEGASARRIAARFDPKQFEEERVSAVQYIRFSLNAEEGALLADLRVPAAVEIDHPSYRRSAPLADELRRSLAAGLQRDPEPLFELPAGVVPAQDALLFELGRLRVIACAGDPTDLVVRTSEALPARSWLAGEWSLGADLEEALRRAARHVAAHAGSVRIEARVGSEGEGLRWRVRSSARR